MGWPKRETNTAWQHHHLRASLTSRERKHFGATNVSFGYPDTTTDPVPDKEIFQSGGSITMTTGSLIPMLHGGHIKDPTGLGCWSGHTLQGKSNAFLSIFSAYQACLGSIGTSPIGSTFSREYEHLHRSQQLVSPIPQKQMIQDLIAAIKLLQTSGHTDLLMMDSNAQIHEDQDLQRPQTECDLHNLHHTNPAPSTYVGEKPDALTTCLDVRSS